MLNYPTDARVLHSFVAAMVLALCGCSEPTANGSIVFSETISEPEGVVMQRNASLTLGAENPTKLEFIMATDGVAIASIDCLLADHGGWQVSLAGRGEPINTGTEEAPVMSVPLIIQRYRTSLTGKHTRQHSLTATAAGSVELSDSDER